MREAHTGVYESRLVFTIKEEEEDHTICRRNRCITYIRQIENTVLKIRFRGLSRCSLLYILFMKGKTYASDRWIPHKGRASFQVGHAVELVVFQLLPVVDVASHPLPVHPPDEAP